ncbi:MAG: hypothetical protein ACTSYI_09250 [Promethearchaeota archaeon]
MSIKLKYNLTQAAQGIKRSPLLIIGLAIALSMVGVLNIYIYNAKTYRIENSKYSYFDIGIYDNDDTCYNPLAAMDFFDTNYSSLVELTEDTFPISSSNPFLFLTNDFIQLTSNQDNIDNQSEGLTFAFSDPSFFNSNDFDRDFEIYSGRKPQNSSEIIIDIVSAAKLGYLPDLESNISINFFNSSQPSQIIQNHTINISSNCIVGIFIPKQEMIEIAHYSRASLRFYYSINSVDTIQKANTEDWKKASILGVFDPEIYQSHPILNEFAFKSLTISQNYTEPWNIYSGIGFHYDRTTINPNQIGKELKEFREKWMDFYYSVDTEEIRMSTNVYDLLERTQEYSMMFFSMQLMNVPLILCILLIGQLLVKTSFSTRLSSFHQSLIKGYPKKMVITQLMIEILFMGVCVGLGSLFFSWILYKPVQTALISNLFSSRQYGNSEGHFVNIVLYPPENFLPFSLNFMQYFSAIGIGVLTSLILYIRIIIQLKHIKIYELTDSLEQRGLEAGLNENILLSRKARKRETNRLKKQEVLQINDSTDEPNKFQGHDEHRGIYKSDEYEFKRTIKHFGLIFFFIGWIPLILIFLMRWGSISTNDGLVFISQTIFRFNIVLSFLAFLSPFFLIYGIIRWIIFEHPLIYANLCEKFSRLFIGEKAIINGLETIRYQSLKTIALVLALVSGLFITSNIYIYSNANIEPTIDNLILGSDLNIHAEYTYSAMADGNNTIAYEDLRMLEAKFSNESLYSDQFSSVQVTSILSLTDLSSGNYNYRTMVITNFSQYIDFAQQDFIKKLMPSFAFKLQNVIQYNEINEDLPGILVTQEFLDQYQYEIGETFTINPTLFPFTTSFSNETTFLVKIIDVIGAIPGIFYEYGGRNDEMLFDASNILSPNQTVNYDTLNFMVNIIPEDPSNLDLSTIDPTLPLENIPEIYQMQLSVDIAEEIPDFQSQLFNPHGSALEFYLLYLELILIIFFLVTCMIFLILLYDKANKQYYGLLLVQGFGKRNLSLLILSRLIFTVFFSFFIGIGIGFLTGYAWTSSVISSNLLLGQRDITLVNVPIVFHLPEFLIIVLFLCGGISLVYVIFQILNRNKEYSSYLAESE